MPAFERLGLQDGADVIKQLSLKGFDLAGGESEAAHVEECEQNPFLAEPKIDGHQISEAPHEQQRSHDEHQGNRDLHHDKETLERKALAGSGETAPSALDSGARFDMRGAKGGREAEDGASERAKRSQ